jgi:glycosyltransferase involved in cell wall biosynthesis
MAEMAMKAFAPKVHGDGRQRAHDKSEKLAPLCPPLRLLVLVEADRVTGPLKLLFEFCEISKVTDDASAAGAAAQVSLATYIRGPKHLQDRSELVAAASAAGAELNSISERFRFDHRVLRQLRDLAARCRPDIIQTDHVKSHFLLRLSGLHRQFPWIAFHHGYTTTDLKDRLYNQLDRWSLLAAQRIITVSHASARELSRLGVAPSRVRIIPSAVRPFRPTINSGEAKALRNSIGLRDGERMLFAIGRLSREKAHVNLVIALKKVCEQLPEAPLRLVIAGDGPERSRIEAMADSLGVRERLILLGHVADPHPYYAAADLMVLPSDREGSPLVLLEAMAAGLPIVATSVGGVPEVVTPRQNGILVAPRDPYALADGILSVLRDPKLAAQLGMNASRYVAASHSPEGRARALMQVYRELVAPQPAEPTLRSP